MALANKSDILERIFVEGGRQFNEAWGGMLATPTDWQEFCQIIRTNAKRLDLPFIEDFPRFMDLTTVGGNVQFADLSAGLYGITPRRHGAGIKMKDEDVDDDTLGIIIGRVNELIQSAAVEMNRQSFDAVKSGIAVTNYGACADGTQAFFSATHYGYPASPGIPAVTNQSNYVAAGGATAWYLLDCSKPYKPVIMAVRKDPVFVAEDAGPVGHFFEADEYRWKIEGRLRAGYGMWQQAYCQTNALTEDTLWAAVEAMRGMRNKQGLPLNIQPTHLLAAPDTEQVAQNLIARAFIQGTAAAPSNEPVKSLRLRLLVSSFLA